MYACRQTYDYRIVGRLCLKAKIINKYSLHRKIETKLKKIQANPNNIPYSVPQSCQELPNADVLVEFYIQLLLLHIILATFFFFFLFSFRLLYVLYTMIPKCFPLESVCVCVCACACVCACVRK